MKKEAFGNWLYFLAVFAWILLVVFETLFQLVAVGLQPKLFSDINGLSEFMNTPLGQFREWANPLWLNHGPISTSLAVMAIILTISWRFLNKSGNSEYVADGAL